jgi:hypothetical protein
MQRHLFFDASYTKLHSSSGARIRVTIDNYSHQTHEKTLNIILDYKGNPIPELGGLARYSDLGLRYTQN